MAAAQVVLLDYKNTFSESGKHIAEFSFQYPTLTYPFPTVRLMFNNTVITKIIFPKFINGLGPQFSNCENLKEVVMNGVLKHVSDTPIPIEDNQNQQNGGTRNIVSESVYDPNKVGGTFYGCHNLEKIILLKNPEIDSDYTSQILFLVTDYIQLEQNRDAEQPPHTTMVFLENAYIYIPDQYVNDLNDSINSWFESIPEDAPYTFINKKYNFVKGLSELALT